MATVCRRRALNLTKTSLQKITGTRQQSSKALEQVCDVLEKSHLDESRPSAHKYDDVILQFRPPRLRFTHLPRGHVNFRSRDYLGLSCHPEIVTTQQLALSDIGTTGMVGQEEGAWVIQLELEEKLAEFHGRESSLTSLVPQCGITDIIQNVLDSRDAIFYDRWNHPFLKNALRNNSAEHIEYSYTNLDELEKHLKESTSRMKVVFTEGVFSRDGTIAPLKEITDLADHYHALLVVDDSHGLGILGDNLRGTEELCGTFGRSFLLTNSMNTTLGLSLGSYTVGPKPVIECFQRVQRKMAHGIILPSPIAATAIKSLEMLPRMKKSVLKLRNSHTSLAARLNEAGFSVVGNAHPIVQVQVGKEHIAQKMVDTMFERGVLGYHLMHPHVPKGEARIGVTCTALHSYKDIDLVCEALVEAGSSVGLITSHDNQRQINTSGVKPEHSIDIAQMNNNKPKSNTNWKL